jgi:asparagine N-glycosylation enzyme membrane subunit Stt3
VPERSAPPAARAVAAGIVLEGLLLAGYAVYAVVESVRGEAQDLVGALVLAVVALALAGGLGAVALGVLRGQRWARSPALVWQLLQAFVALSGAGWPPSVTIALVLLAVLVALGLFRDDVIARDV